MQELRMELVLDGWDQFRWDPSILQTNKRLSLDKQRPNLVSTIPVAVRTCIS